MPKLFESEESADSGDETLKVNKEYAKVYEDFRHKEELQKLKARYGEDALKDSDENDSSSSDDEEEEINFSKKFENQFYKVLSCLKEKNPKIYDKNVRFFDEVDELVDQKESNKKKKDKDKALYLRDYERKLITEKGGKLSDSEDDFEMHRKIKEKPTYVEEQRQIKESLKSALNKDSDDEDTLLKIKNENDEKEKQENDVKEWLKGQKDDIKEEDQEDLKYLKNCWTDPKLDEDQKYLRDFFLGNRWKEKENDEEPAEYNLQALDPVGLSEDEADLEKQEEFEHKYNFRFEEPDPEFIKRYPRTFENSLRKKNTKRAEKRAEVKARKEQEKLKKCEELKRLKALKRKEIEKKIEQLKEITGNNDLKLDEVDLDGDFDPEEHDRKMKELFNENYYEGPEGEFKPEFPDIDEKLNLETNWDDIDPTDKEKIRNEFATDEQHCEDPDFNMDADYDPDNVQEEVVESRKQRKRRKRSKFLEVIAKEKPKFDPAKYPSYEEYFDKYYAMDYEDMIGDIPCRFKYRKVIPNNYGLTVEEIIAADDRELNKWCSLKRALQYRPDYLERNDVESFKRKGADENLKRKILKSLYSAPQEINVQENEIPKDASDGVNLESTKKKKRKRKKNGNFVEEQKSDFDTEKQETEKSEEQINGDKIESEDKTEEPSRKKKRKSKNNLSQNEETEFKFKTNNLENSELENHSKSKTDGEELNKKQNNDEGKIAPTSEYEDTADESSKKKKKKSKNELTQVVNIKSEPKTVSKTSSPEKLEKNQRKGKKHTQLMKQKIAGAMTSDMFSPNSVKASEKLSEKPQEKNVNKKSKKQKVTVIDKATTNSDNRPEGPQKLSKKQLRKEKFKKLMKEKANKVMKATVLSDDRLKAYGLNPKKFKNKMKYSKK